jgi:hypothetical protein
VQQQARRLADYLRRCIQPVAQNGVPKRLQVYAQLVASACLGLQGDAAGMVQRVVVQHVKARCAGFAHSMVDFLAGSIGPVADEWQVNFARRRSDTAVNHRDIVLADLTLLKQAVEDALYLLTQRDDHQPRSFHIQSVHAFRLRKPLTRTCQQ